MESFPWVQSVRKNAPVIAPSILAADFAHLADEIKRVENAGAQVIHVDVMDGHFVPNISVGIPVVASLRKITSLPLDVHLMITDPAKYIKPFRDAGADSLLIHIEAEPNPQELLAKIRDLGAAPGLVLNPATPVELILPYVELADIVLIMSVQPGFGGQAFRPEVLSKVSEIRKKMRPDAIISIDGGIYEKTIGRAGATGIDLFVTGTGLFGANDYNIRLQSLFHLAKTGKFDP